MEADSCTRLMDSSRSQLLTEIAGAYGCSRCRTKQQYSHRGMMIRTARTDATLLSMVE